MSLRSQAQALSFIYAGVTYVAQGELGIKVVGTPPSFSGTITVTDAPGARVGSIHREVLTDWVLTPASSGSAGH